MRYIVVLLAFAGMSQAQPPVFPVMRTLGVVGITTGQTARIAVLNGGSPLPTALAAAHCTAVVTFLNDQGAVLKTATVTVDAGKSATVDLNRDTDVPAGTPRVEIHATVAATPVAGTGPQPMRFCSVTPTLQVFDNASGKTTVVLAQ